MGSLVPLVIQLRTTSLSLSISDECLIFLLAAYTLLLDCFENGANFEWVNRHVPRGRVCSEILPEINFTKRTVHVFISITKNFFKIKLRSGREYDWDTIIALYENYGITRSAETTDINSAGCGHDKQFVVRDVALGECICSVCGSARRSHTTSGHHDHRLIRSNYDPRFHSHERYRMAACTGTWVPDSELREIYHELRKAGGWRRAKCDTFSRNARNRIREVLGSLNAREKTRYWSKWLEQWVQITDRLTEGLPVPSQIENHVDELDRYWKDVMYAWTHVRPEGRKHLPNYAYMIIRISEFIGIGELAAPWFPQLLTVSKVQQAEKYWFDICDYNKWPKVSLFNQFYEDHTHLRPWHVKN